MSRKESEMLDHYDFSQGVRGKYAKSYAEGINIVVLEQDVTESLSDDQSVNGALRSLIKIASEKK